MNMRLHKNKKNLVFKLSLVCSMLCSFTTSAQVLEFIEHKPTGFKMQVCDGALGKPVTSRANTNVGPCVQWERVFNGNYFHLRSFDADKFIKPDTGDNGSPISIQPKSWTGNWTQWSYEDRGDGYGHITNRATGKLIFLSAKNRAIITQQPSAWRGDFTRWRFVPTDGLTPTPTPTPTGSPHPNGSPTLDCRFTPSISNIIRINENETLFVTCASTFGAGDPDIKASFRGDFLSPVEIRVSSFRPVEVEYDFEVDLTNYIGDPNHPYRNTFSATADGPGSEKPTIKDYEVETIFVSVTPPPDTPTPTPTATSCPSSPPTSNIYEAESGNILGTASIYSDGNASGGEGVAFISSTGAGVSVTNEIFGSYFTVRYASQLSGKISYRINGQDSGDFNFTSTGAWVGAYQDIRVDAEIPGGANVEIFFDAGDAALNIDYIKVSTPGFGGCPTPTPTPTNAPGPFDLIDVFSNSQISDKDPGPLPLANPVESLGTPILGMAPTSHGFAFDLTAEQVVWRASENLITTGLVEYYCSEDGGLSYEKATLVDNRTENMCSGEYLYFFRYEHPSTLNDNPAHRWVYTASFTTAGERVDPNNYPEFTDGTANRMRFRHPISADGTTVSVLDAQHNADLLRNLDRYTMWVDDRPGNVRLGVDLNGNLIRNESLRTGVAEPNGQQFFGINQNPGFDNIYSYGQVIQFEITAVAGLSGAQTYNDFSYYTVGLGWGNYGDLRLNSAGRAGTTMIVSDNGAFIELERNSIFAQPVTTLNTEKAIDDYLVGHHLFHGIDPNERGSTAYGNVKIGDRSCGDCHFRDGRGIEVIPVVGGTRLAPPTYGIGLLLAIEGREAGLGRDGRFVSVDDYLEYALTEFHGVDPAQAPDRIMELLALYPAVLSVPNRLPQFTDDTDVNAGSDLFMNIGCADCHTPVQTTASADPAFNGLTIRPYTDMKLWDLGEGEFRTTPLWGLGQNIKLLGHNAKPVLYMHDGQSESVADAIGRHGGDAANSRSGYNSLSSSERRQVDSFVNSL